MSHVDAGPLASYNSLLDPHLAGYFSNTRMRQHLVKSGLITRRGNIVSENTYRLNMARKEHKKHVRDLLAQAIVHKTLDLERTRQVAIKKKLEEIAKEEMVRRVKGEPSMWSEMRDTLRAPQRLHTCWRNNASQTPQLIRVTMLTARPSDGESCNRHGDEELLPYLKPSTKKGSRPSSVPSSSSRKSSEQIRPVSAPSKSQQKRSKSSEGQRGQAFLMLDEEGMPHSTRGRSTSGSTESRSRSRSARSCSKNTSKYPTEELDDRHLYSLNSQTLRDYTMARYDMDSTLGPSPYRLPQLPPDMLPAPPTSHSPRPPSRRQHRGQSAKSHSMSASTNRSNRGQLMLHRQEPAMKHQERVQTLCDVNMHYFGNSLSLDYERFDPRDEVMVEQQHCGGNTLIVYREKILPGSDFTFTSRRHRGYPFSLTFYVNGVLDCRLSTCCEYKHQSGARLGGKQGHFGMVGIDGAAPCYKCQINNTNNKKKRRRRTKHKSKPDEKDENVHVAVEEDEKNGQDVNVRGIGDDQDRHLAKDDSVQVPVEEDQQSAKDDNYEEDFDDDDNDDDDSCEESSSEDNTRTSSGDESGSGMEKEHLDGRNQHKNEADTSEEKNEDVRSTSSDYSKSSTRSSSPESSTLQGSSSSRSSLRSSGGSSNQTSSRSSMASSQISNRQRKKQDIMSDDNHAKSETSSMRSGNEKSRLKNEKSEDDRQLLVDWEPKSVNGIEEKENAPGDPVSPVGEGSEYNMEMSGSCRPVEVRVQSDEEGKPEATSEPRQHLSAHSSSASLYSLIEQTSDDTTANDRESNGSDENVDAGRRKKLRHHRQRTEKDYNYSDEDFDDDDDKKSNASSHSSSYTSSSSGSSSSSSGASSHFSEDVMWNITVYTSKKQFAGTDAGVYIVLHGDTSSKKNVKSNKIILDNSENNFEQGKKDEFKRDAPNFEKLTKIRIGHDNSGAASAWHLDHVVLENTVTGKSFIFHCNNWVSGCEDDNVVERELYPAGSEEAKQSSRIPKVEWNVCVYTSDVRNAGTDSDVYILLTGELKNGEVKESDKMILDNSRNNFERDQCDKFTIKTYDYENLIKLRIGHNNKGIASAWHLNKIVLENANSGKSYAFYCNKWLADNKGDQAIERELFPAGSEQARKSDRAKKAKWNVNVYTSDVRNAGTDSDVYIVLIGETEDGEVKESDKMILDNNKNNFERGQCDQFSIETYDYVKLTKLRIGHNNNGFGAAWHLNKVIVENTSSGTKYTFHCNKWLADDEDDCVVERELEPNTESNEEPMRERQQQGSIEQNKEDAKGSISSSTSTLKSTNEDDASVKIKAERATKAKQMLTSKDTGGEPIKNSIISNEGMSRSDKDSTKGNSSPRGSDINLVSSSDNGSSGCSDEGSLSDKDSTRNNDKGSPRGSDKPSPQPIDKDSTPMSDKCSHRTSNDGSGSSSDENSSRSIDRGSHTDEGLTRKSERDFPRGSDKGSLQGSNKGSPTGSDKGSPRGTDIGSPQCSNKGSPRDIDRDSQQRGEMSHENNDATSSREMDDKPSEDPDIAQENNKEKQSPDGDHSNEDTSEQNIVDASNEKQKPREDTDRESLSSSSSSSYTSDSSDSSSEDNKQMQAPDQPEDKTGEQNGKDVTDHTNSIIAAGEEFEGSIRPLIEGKKNIELINIMLNQHQVQELCDVIRETGEVETLVLRHSNLSDNDLEKLAAALISTSSDDLEMLNLNFNNITSAGVPHLVNIVKNKRNLQVLLLHNTAIGDEGLNMLVDALLQANDSRNKDADTIKEMAKGIVTNVIKNAIESSSAQGTEETNSQEGSDMTSGGGSENEKLVSALEDLNKLGALKLEQLDIGDCQITDNGVESLAKLIAANTQLDHLCLTGNKAITPSAWKKLGEALRSNTNLYDCGLDYTDLRDQGVISLLDGAEGNKGLHSLDLEGNKIGDEGGRKILQFLHNHPNVKDLNLMPGNHINQFLLGEIKQEIAQKN